MNDDQLYDDMVTIPADECAHMVDFSKVKARLMQVEGMNEEDADDHIELLRVCIYDELKEVLRPLYHNKINQRKADRANKRKAALVKLAAKDPEIAALLVDLDD